MGGKTRRPPAMQSGRSAGRVGATGARSVEFVAAAAAVVLRLPFATAYVRMRREVCVLGQ